MAEAKTTKKKKQRKSIISGLAYINATFNNTMITITDEQGNSIAVSYTHLTLPTNREV